MYVLHRGRDMLGLFHRETCMLIHACTHGSSENRLTLDTIECVVLSFWAPTKQE